MQAGLALKSGPPGTELNPHDEWTARVETLELTSSCLEEFEGGNR